MISEKKPGQFVSGIFETLPGIKHSFCGKIFGDMRTENARQKLCISAGFTPGGLSFLNQAHGNDIRLLTPDRPVIHCDTADGLLAVRSEVPHACLAVKSADCLPILLADPDAGIIAAVHAGWKGTVRQIAAEAIRMMIHAGSRPECIYAAFGPSICPSCYTVDPERADLFRRTFVAAVDESDGRVHIDLKQANREILISNGLKTDHIDSDSPCTACYPDTFYSYRKKDKEYGQQMSVIAFTE